MLKRTRWQQAGCQGKKQPLVHPGMEIDRQQPNREGMNKSAGLTRGHAAPFDERVSPSRPSRAKQFGRSSASHWGRDTGLKMGVISALRLNLRWNCAPTYFGAYPRSGRRDNLWKHS